MTGYVMAGLGFSEPGLDLLTAREAEGAAAGEAAAAGQVDRVRQLSLEESRRVVEDRRRAVADRGDGRQQGLGVVVERALEEIARRRHLHQLAQVHDRDAVAHE